MGDIIDLPFIKKSKEICALPDGQIDGSFNGDGIISNISSSVFCLNRVATGTVAGQMKYRQVGEDLDFYFISKSPVLLASQRNNGLCSMGTVFIGVTLAEKNSDKVMTTDGILHLTATQVKGGWFGSYILLWLKETASGVRKVMRLALSGFHMGRVTVNRETFWRNLDETESGTMDDDFLPVLPPRGIIFAGAVDGFIDDQGVSTDISAVIRNESNSLTGNVRGSIRAFKINGSWEFGSLNPVGVTGYGEGSYPDHFLGHSLGAIFNKVNLNNQRDCIMYLTMTQVQTNPIKVPGNAWFGSYIIITPEGGQVMMYGRFPGLALKSTNNFCAVL